MLTPIILTKYTSKKMKKPPLFLLWVEKIVNINENFRSDGVFVNTWVYYDIGENSRVRNKVFIVKESILEINQKIHGDEFLGPIGGVI